ncbi:hypothetical protein Aple_081900 [Acrocarpospora pleiomorpha]|uniref:Uncharacterized protein n=1 Tax=Acrocarpospora pleiomorpha TaxID=90975 RepID=A0A5M3Y0G0_9ACTN|nr:hypothetical protein Aple_081900 [Acrocarpospora pleiomorpha]
MTDPPADGHNNALYLAVQRGQPQLQEVSGTRPLSEINLVLLACRDLGVRGLGVDEAENVLVYQVGDL